MPVTISGTTGIGTPAVNATGNIQAASVNATGNIQAVGNVIGTGVCPAGVVLPFATSTAPFGWLICDGTTILTSGTLQGVDVALLQTLRNLLGTTYGSLGQLPDLRGEFIRGWDGGRGIDSGRSFGSRQKGTITTFNTPRNEAFTHGLMAGASDQAGAGRLAALGEVGADLADPVDYTGTTTIAVGGGGINSNSTWMNDAGWGGGVTRPRNIALLYCIKY